MPANTIRLGLIQHACPVDAPKEANIDKAVALMRDAAKQGAELIVTQELFASHYFCQVEDADLFALAETIPGPTSDRLCAVAKELGVEISASLFEKRTAGLYHNTTIVIDAGGAIIGKYRKMHIPDDPRFYEKFYFTPGDPAPGSYQGAAGGNRSRDGSNGVGWQTHRLRNATIGTLVCWDQWFPEAARLTALRGAQILLYPTAIGYASSEPEGEPQRQMEAWRTVQRAHAITNGVFVAAINRVGVEGELTFWGRSFVADPGGQVIAEADGESEQVLLAECDLSTIDAARHGWPFLRDRRIDAYQDLLRRVVD